MKKLHIDCLILIFNQLDKNSLYSCLLVNKEWCDIVVPILWKQHKWEEKLLNTILSCLPFSSKQLLSDNDIKLPLTILSKSTLFNYISFCKFPNFYVMDKIIKEEFHAGDLNKKFLLEQEIYKLFVSQCKNITKLLWETSQPLSLFPGASTCFPQLYSLGID